MLMAIQAKFVLLPKNYRVRVAAGSEVGLLVCCVTERDDYAYIVVERTRMNMNV